MGMALSTKQTLRSRDTVGSPASDNNAENPLVESGGNPVQRAGSDLETVFPGHTTPWSKKLILTLDGGGVLAYSSLIVLKALMDRIRKIEQIQKPTAKSSADSPLFDSKSAAKYVRNNTCIPCHYFDYIAGTSFGGSAAILLGRYRMSVEDCIERFKAHADGFDQEPPIDSISFSLRHPHFGASSWSSSESEKLYRPTSEPTVTNTKRHEDFYMDPSKCKTLAICEQIRKDRAIVEPYIFCSYALTMDRTHPTTVSDVARAITTRHSFKPNEKGQYHDGSLHAYNPSYEVYKEVSALESRDKNAIELLLSLGTSATGADALRKIGIRGFYHFITSNGDSLVSKESQRQKVDSNLRKEGVNYHRLQVPHVLPRRNKQFLPQIEKATSEYLKQTQVRRALQSYAELLVEKRRARAETRSWETFALGIQYRCYVEDCSQHGKNFPGREEFLNHLIKARHVKPPPASTRDEIRKALDDGRV